MKVTTLQGVWVTVVLVHTHQKYHSVTFKARVSTFPMLSSTFIVQCCSHYHLCDTILNISNKSHAKIQIKSQIKWLFKVLKRFFSEMTKTTTPV